MTKERIIFYENLAESLRATIAMNSKITDRVKIFEEVLLSEKIMESLVGKDPKEKIDKYPEIFYKWVKPFQVT
jgi:hypothetical protein